jgi:hypothetical protein
VPDGAAAPYTVLVNTSDSYNDCWIPFFQLFRKAWPKCTAPILLNTEYAGFSYSGIAIHATQVQRPYPDRRLTWSECLITALDQVTTPLVLYMQEDYFLDGLVDARAIDELAGFMLANPAVRHVGLTTFGAFGPFSHTDDPRLWRISRKSRYRISTQAALWRVETLRSYLHPSENGWMFEIYGTRRAARRPETFLTISHDYFRDRPVFPYRHTGIVKGKWHETVPDLFARHGIPMDFSKRGFFKRQPRLIERWHVVKKLLAEPSRIIPGILGR